MAEHRNLTGASLHEPKGAATASANTVYTANGLGSGSWQLPKLLGVETALAGQVYIADGAGSGTFETVFDTPVGRSSLANASVIVAVAAGAIHTPASYVDIQQNFTPSITVGGVTSDGVTKELVIPEDGYYRITGWISVASDTANTSLGFDVTVDGLAGASTSPVARLKVKDAGDITTITGFGIAHFVEGTKIGLAIAATAAVNITLYEGVLDLEKIRD